jgi:hypothetical protein
VLRRNPASGDLESLEFREGTDADLAVLGGPDSLDVLTLFRVDRFINRVLTRMAAVTAGEMPPPPAAELDPMREFVLDADGKPALVGLTAAENAEFLALEEPGRQYATEEEFQAACDRRDALHDQHDRAWLERIHSEAAADQKKGSAA